MNKYDWSRLTPQQVGRYAEYFVKMEFTLSGFEVYEPEVDDHGIDIIVRRKGGRYYEIQVKSVRRLPHKTNYIFFTKSKFEPRGDLLAAIVFLSAGKMPQLYLIPSESWLKPDAVLVERNYEGKKSKPEWGLNISLKNLELLRHFKFERMVRSL